MDYPQRIVAGILSKIRILGGMLGLAEQTDAYAEVLSDRFEKIRAERSARPNRPRVHFKEWGDPMITGIGWVSELIGIAGGEDIFPEKAAEPGARERIIENPDDVITRQPDIIIGSWYGR